jgi:hypothetical protein
MPEEYRSDAWLDRYLQAFVRPDYGPNERHALFDFVLDLANDKISGDVIRDEAVWQQILSIVQQYLNEHQPQIEYWACLDVELVDAFALSPFAREALTKHTSARILSTS